MKKLATLLVAAGFILPLTYNAAEAAPSKAKTVAKKKSTVRRTSRTSARTKAQKPAILSVEGMVPDRYHCEMGKTFTLYRYPHDNSSVILEWAGTRQQMHRVQTRTGAERFETNAKLTYIGVSNLTQLIDFKQGKPVLNDCRNEEQNRVQHELDMKKAEEKAAKAQGVQQKQEPPKKKKKSWWPF
ncbi:MAG: hypothetical protein KIG68_02645 [Oxalobacter sp.]|nr:hypothetical protein [Oxalobacter sp.]